MAGTLIKRDDINNELPHLAHLTDEFFSNAKKMHDPMIDAERSDLSTLRLSGRSTKSHPGDFNLWSKPMRRATAHHIRQPSCCTPR